MSAGWYIKSIGPERPASTVNPPRDFLALKRGDHVTGLLITFAEGAANLNGRISAAEGQVLPLRMRAYLVPAEREAATNLLRFYEAIADQSGSFKFENVAPGRYLIIARRSEEGELGMTKFVRQDETLRTKVRQEAEALNKSLILKPCEQVADFNLQASSPER